MNLIKRVNLVIMVGFLSVKEALAGYDIRSAGGTYGSYFERLVDFFQGVIDFVQGPFAVGFIILGIVIAGCFWIFAPDNRHLNKACKAIAVGFVLFDIAIILDAMVE